MSNRDTAIGAADDVYEDVKAINHALISRTSIPAPVAYAVLGNLKLAGHGLSEVAGHLSRGLRASLDEYDVYDNNRDPAQSVAMARASLDRAAELAAEIGDLLSAAQSSINLQGYNIPEGGESE